MRPIDADRLMMMYDIQYCKEHPEVEWNVPLSVVIENIEDQPTLELGGKYVGQENENRNDN